MSQTQDDNANDDANIDGPTVDSPNLDSIGRSYRSSISSQLQAVQAEYYTIVDAEEWPIAGLIVLVDGRKQPVRAEYLYEELADHRNEFALRQAQIVINERYYSDEPIQLQVMQSYAWRETLQVRTSSEPIAQPVDPLAFVQQYWQYILAASAALVLIALIWALTAFFRSSDEETPTTAATTEQNQAAAAATTPEVAPTQIVAQTNDLPASRNADTNLAIGQRMRVLPNVEAVSLVSEPSPDQAKVVGHLLAGNEAMIINGPVLKQGNSDTIVWWFVRLESGQEAWVPANTSEMTLLEVAQ